MSLQMPLDCGAFINLSAFVDDNTLASTFIGRTSRLSWSRVDFSMATDFMVGIFAFAKLSAVQYRIHTKLFRFKKYLPHLIIINLLRRIIWLSLQNQFKSKFFKCPDIGCATYNNFTKSNEKNLIRSIKLSRKNLMFFIIYGTAVTGTNETKPFRGKKLRIMATVDIRNAIRKLWTKISPVGGQH